MQCCSPANSQSKFIISTVPFKMRSLVKFCKIIFILEAFNREILYTKKLLPPRGLKSRKRNFAEYFHNLINFRNLLCKRLKPVSPWLPPGVHEQHDLCFCSFSISFWSHFIKTIPNLSSEQLFLSCLLSHPSTLCSATRPHSTAEIRKNAENT